MLHLIYLLLTSCLSPPVNLKAPKCSISQRTDAVRHGNVTVDQRRTVHLKGHWRKKGLSHPPTHRNFPTMPCRDRDRWMAGWDGGELPLFSAHSLCASFINIPARDSSFHHVFCKCEFLTSPPPSLSITVYPQQISSHQSASRWGFMVNLSTICVFNLWRPVVLPALYPGHMGKHRCWLR